MKFLVKYIERLTSILGLIGAWLVIPLIFATCWEVFARYVLNAPTVWSYEIGYMVTGSLVMLGAALALKNKAHIRIDVLYSRYSEKKKALVDIIGYVLFGLPTACWLSWGLWEYTAEGYITGERSGESAWNPVIWPFRFVFFLGVFLLALQLLAEVLKSINTLRSSAKTDAEEGSWT